MWPVSSMECSARARGPHEPRELRSLLRDTLVFALPSAATIPVPDLRRDAHDSMPPVTQLEAVRHAVKLLLHARRPAGANATQRLASPDLTNPHLNNGRFERCPARLIQACCEVLMGLVVQPQPPSPQVAGAAIPAST